MKIPAASASPHHTGAGRPGDTLRAVDHIQNFCLGLLVFAGAFVIIDAPYNVAFLLAALSMVVAGFRLSLPLMPLIILVLLYLLGGIFSLFPHIDLELSSRYIMTMFFLACTTFYFAIQMQDHTAHRLAVIRRATIISSLIACVIGLAGYFDIAGLGPYFRVHEGRASATFRDPNVFGSFLVLPAIYLLQDLIVGEKRGLWWRALAFATVVLLILLSFSRGSWIAFVVAVFFLVMLTMMTDVKRQGRILLMFGIALVVLVAAIAVALSIDSIRDMFLERAKFTQSYDEGRSGRFGKLVVAIPKLLESPNGLGPLRFAIYFFEDPHNTYVNGFTNFGWLGGLSYLVLIGVTLAVGFRHVFERSPWQRDAIAIWAALLVHFVQGMQIDTNTWRHFNMMLGLIWGMAAAWTVIRWRETRHAAAKQDPLAPGVAARIARA